MNHRPFNLSTSIELEMSNNGRKSTNTENFHDMMRRSSNRLRGGSVPPPDSGTIVPTVAVTSIRGRGRNRGTGSRVISSSSRIASQSPQAKGVTPVVTLTVPGANEETTSNLPTNSNQAAPQASTTSVIHSVGLISRDDVNAIPNRKLQHEICFPTSVMPHDAKSRLSRFRIATTK